MKKIAITLLLSTAAVSSFAADQGFYAALDAGRSTAKDACVGAPTCSESDYAYRIGGGYQFTQNLGIEASYAIMGSVTASGILSSPPGVAALTLDVKPKTLQVAAIGTIPVTDAFSLLGKLGVARTSIDSTATCLGSCAAPSASLSATSTKLAYGIGAQYELSKGFGFRAQYEYLGEVGDANTTGTAKLSLISAGFILKF